MVGRSKTCSSRDIPQNNQNVVSFRQIEKVKEQRDLERKLHYFIDLTQWFHRYWKKESQTGWQNRFKKLLQLPHHKPIPPKYQIFFQHWLLFDAACLNQKRPVELWSSRFKGRSNDRFIHNFCNSVFDCFEIVERGLDSFHFRSLKTERSYEVRKGSHFLKGSIIFARLIRCGNRFELFGPYTSFGYEMRGEIMVQLEKYKQEEQHDIATREDGWKLLGWAIQKAKESERIESIVSPPVDLVEQMHNHLLWSEEEEKQVENPGLSVEIMQQLEQYYVSQVSPLQKTTQVYYSRTLELLFEYLSKRFGQDFKWSMLTEDVLCHFLSIWYLENAKPTPTGSRIFLNTLKGLFRWLSNEGISPVYHTFKKVYIHLIRSLPAALEIKKWLKEHGTSTQQAANNVSNLYLFSISNAGPVIYIEDQWKVCNFRNFPSLYTNQRFWLRGVISHEQGNCKITEVHQIYPMIPLNEEIDQERKLIARK